MKRDYLTIWHKLQGKFHERPSKKALDKMALLVGYQDWQSFLDSFEDEGKEKEE